MSTLRSCVLKCLRISLSRFKVPPTLQDPQAQQVLRRMAKAWFFTISCFSLHKLSVVPALNRKPDLDGFATLTGGEAVSRTDALTDNLTENLQSQDVALRTVLGISQLLAMTPSDEQYFYGNSANVAATTFFWQQQEFGQQSSSQPAVLSTQHSILLILKLLAVTQNPEQDVTLESEAISAALWSTLQLAAIVTADFQSIERPQSGLHPNESCEDMMAQLAAVSIQTLVPLMQTNLPDKLGALPAQRWGRQSLIALCSTLQYFLQEGQPWASAACRARDEFVDSGQPESHMCCPMSHVAFQLDIAHQWVATSASDWQQLHLCLVCIQAD